MPVMSRCIGPAFAVLLATGSAWAQSCDINADSAAVVAAWGAKMRDQSLPRDQLSAISDKIQQVPSLGATDPEQACAVLRELKAQLGI
jgi:hypothetical protein